MSSLLSHHHLSRAWIAPYLRGYQHSLPVSPDAWAAAESMGFGEGTIIICLEPVVPLSASADRAAQADAYRMTELAVVICTDNGRPIVIRLTSETYELIFLEKLMVSKAQDAKLIERDFSYLIVEPTDHLSETQVRALTELGNSYARGGSRREKNAAGTGPVDPSLSLLGLLGLQVDPAAAKQVLDNSLFCQLIFEPVDPPAECPLRNVKAGFRPVPGAGQAEQAEELRQSSKTTTTDFTHSIPQDEWIAETQAQKQFDGEPAALPEPPGNTGMPLRKGLGQLVPGADTDASKNRRERLKDDLQTLLGLGGIFADSEAPQAVTAQDPAAPAPNLVRDENSNTAVPARSTDELSQQITSSVNQAINDILGDYTPAKEAGADAGVSAATTTEDISRQEPANSTAEPGTAKKLSDLTPFATADGRVIRPPAARSILESAWSSTDNEEPASDKSGESSANSGGLASIASEITSVANDPASTAPNPTSLINKLDSAAKTSGGQASPKDGEAPPRRPSLEIKAPPPLDKPGRPAPGSQISTDKESAEASPAPWEKMPADSTSPALSKPEEIKLEEEELEGDEEEDDDEDEDISPRASVKRTLEDEPAPTRKPPSRESASMRAAAGAGMESVVLQVEQKISKVTSKLISQVDEIHSGLEDELKRLIERVSSREGEGEDSMRQSLSTICKQLDELAEESRLKVSDGAANGRYAIKQLLEQGQKELDDAQKACAGSLDECLSELKTETDKLAGAIKTKLNGMVAARTAELNELVDSICAELNKTNQDFSYRLQQRFERLRERLAYEGQSTSQSLERHVHSLKEDLDGLCDRAYDKIRSSKTEHEIGLRQLVTMYQLNLSQSANSLMTDSLTPKLRQYREKVGNERYDLEKKLACDAVDMGRRQQDELDACMVRVKQQMQGELSDVLGKLDSLGQEKKDEYSRIFKSINSYIEERIEKAQAIFAEAEAEITQNDAASRKLVESSGAGVDPTVALDKDSSIKLAQESTNKAISQMQATFDEQCEKLERHGSAAAEKLSKAKEKHTREVSESAKEAVALIRKAIQDASEAIRATQEKYME